MKPKILAINLPAFHQIPENDEWWWEGFTEWDNVKMGKKFFKNHHQPMEPLEGYYNLSKEEDIMHQIELAKNYGVHGFVYYHYWFDSNKMLFEKPVEKILNKNIDFGYCFCWANETWMTTWHGRDPKLLMEQKYGDEKEWKIHFDYLIKFFKDKNYLKKDNKPFMFIYKPNHIHRYDDMVDFFNNEAKKHGLDGVYFIEYISSKNTKLFSQKSSAVMEFEPLYTTYFDISVFNKAKRLMCKKLKVVDYQNYNKLWRYKLKRNRTYEGKNIFKSCFVNWDNSARKGKNSMIVKGATPKVFGENLRKLVKQNRKDADPEYIVINAWNEWSEGAYLEPDKKNEYKYLEEIKKTIEE